VRRSVGGCLKDKTRIYLERGGGQAGSSERVPWSMAWARNTVPASFSQAPHGLMTRAASYVGGRPSLCWDHLMNFHLSRLFK